MSITPLENYIGCLAELSLLAKRDNNNGSANKQEVESEHSSAPLVILSKKKISFIVKLKTKSPNGTRFSRAKGEREPECKYSKIVVSRIESFSWE